MIKTLNKISAFDTLETKNLEIELILCCARTKLDECFTSNIKALLEKKLDWHYLLKVAAEQGIVPLVYYNLNRTFPQQVPVEILTQLHQHFQANVQRNLLLTAELIKILKVLEDNKVEAITFKGPTLAIKAYGQLALRQFCDLDVFIEEKNSLEVVNLLVSLGYQLPSPIAQLARHPYMTYQEFLESEETQKKYELFHAQKNIVIDLQWSLTERRINRFFPVNFQHISSNSSSIYLGATEIKQFSSEDMLLYLCFHGSKHCWSELKWICDVAEFIQSNLEIDWQLISLRAKEWKVERMLSLGLCLVENILKIELSETIKQNIEIDEVVIALANKVKRGIFECSLTEKEKIDFRFKLRKQLSEQIFYFLDILFTPTAKEWNFLPFTLPKSLSFLYRLVRPYRLAKESFLSK
ncbi:hypothetical protein C7B62_21155 [Pleurocapsa sp. CCALA 161]|uniref:nucleotidyltransferase domain-containing protein n=1 Tax=Pleurocapsa sp. CCALA 161 TaxID=2107688 RepID=UPI000D04AE25|nr:nucleotidyltransferase family protein [Pleurocapsa sp. CCALA 161]PSB07017.1 hypothetical protein C7B62_21155 [Pleurocapsa sp. CCALA 161]